MSRILTDNADGSASTITSAQFIDGSADTIQLRVQGNGTQTSNIFQLENSSAISLGSVTNAGAWTLGPASTSTTHIVNGLRTHHLSASTTAETYTRYATSNLGNSSYVGQESSIGGQLITGAAGYCLALSSLAGVYFSGNNGTNHGNVSTAGAWTLGADSTTPTHRLNISNASTVGAAGGASALPATPTGYITININGTDRKIPYYAT